MQAIVITDRNFQVPLTTADVPSPEVTDDTLLIRVKVAGINFADIMQIRGSYPRRLPTPYTPGHEVAGEVVAVGKEVAGFSVGDRVASLLPLGGGYAEYALAQPGRTLHLPSELSDADATALLTQGLTAFVLVEQFVNAGDRVLITAAAGGVGSIALQLAIQRGASVVYGTASSPEKVKLIETLGGTGIDYRQPDWVQPLLDDGLEVDVVLDSVGGNILQEAWRLLNDQGAVVNYGNASFDGINLSDNALTALHIKNQRLHFFGFSRYLEADPTLYKTALKKLITAKLTGELQTPVHPPYPLQLASQALDDLLARKTQGKLVLDCKEEAFND